MRLFLSFNIEPNIKDEFFKVQRELSGKLSHLPQRAIKWEDKSKFHLTIFFLGDVDNPKMSSLISGLESFSAGLNYKEFLFESSSLGCFPNPKNPRVIFADVINPGNDVFEFYDALLIPLKNAGFIPDKKFHLHITFGRVKYRGRFNIENEMKSINFGINFSVNGFYLMQSVIDSHGSVYKEIKKFAI
jgi:2'-5' RNA ligase